MGNAITAITFLYFLTDNERYKLLDYFGNRELLLLLLLLFFFDVEDPAHNEKLCTEMMRKIRSLCL